MRVPGFPPKRPGQRLRSQVREPDETTPLDAVAVTLAVWLGLIACVTGVIRLSENASAQAALARQGDNGVQQIDLSKTLALGG